jgi:hypothetical protein
MVGLAGRDSGMRAGHCCVQAARSGADSAARNPISTSAAGSTGSRGWHHHAPGRPGEGIAALSRLGQDYPKARLALCGFGPAGKNLTKRLAGAGLDAAHINIVSQSRTTAEDAHYSAALLKPKPDESWLLITAAMHMPRAVGCFRAVGFQVQPYPLEFVTRGRSGPFALFATGSSALIQFDRAAKEWIGLIAYRVMGKTDTLFPGP